MTTAWWFHLAAMAGLVAVLVWAKLNRYRVVKLFTVSTALCLIELALWPLSIKHPMLWYCMEIATVTTRFASAIEAVWRRVSNWILAGAAGIAVVGVCAVVARPMQANLWVPGVMRLRGALWASLALSLIVAATHQWTAVTHQESRWRWHLTVMALYFSEHGALAFHVGGDWWGAIGLHHWLTAAIYAAWIAVWSWPPRDSSHHDK